MDEHIQLAAGRTITLRNDIVDDNRHGLTSWIDKHNHYATREAAEVLSARHGFAKLGGVEPKCFGTQEQRKRWVKERLYARLPLGLRAILYFTLRYFVRGGFLDGYPGLVFHVLQGFWYRFLVDAKVFEIEQKMRTESLDAKTILARDYGVHID